MHFIDWTENSSVTLCVYKPNDEDAASFQLLPPQMESDNPLEISLLYKNGDSFRQKHCQIIFFSEGTEAEVQHILSMETDSKILSIGETSQFITQGGMINLIRKDSRIKFEINMEALNQAGFSISSQILRIADQVYTGEESD